MDSAGQPQAGSVHQIRPSSLYAPQRSDTMPMPTLPSLNSSMGATKRKRSPEKTPSQKPNKMIKKSHSTPMMAPGSMSPTDSDKKRNKLGYHRTSVACGHCRRRKIRCMMPDDDPTGRCSNCIRLKKECNFYPVDQNVGGKGPHPSNRAVSMPKSGLRSHNSPTPMYLPSSYDGFSHYGQGHNSFSVPPPDTTGLGLFNTSTGPSFHEPQVTYPAGYDDPSTTWNSSPYATLPPISAPQETHLYTHGLSAHRQFESPLSVSPAPPPYTRPSSTQFRPSPFPDSAYGSAVSCRTPSNEIGWAPPQQQSAGAAASTYRASYSPAPTMDDRRSTSVNNPPSLVMSTENSVGTPTLSEPTTIGPMSAPSHGSSYWQQPWTPLPGSQTDIIEPSKTFSAAEPFEQSWFPGTEVNGY